MGYLHRPEDYLRSPDRQFGPMARYENAMALYGYESGQMIEELSKGLIDTLAAGV